MYSYGNASTHVGGLEGVPVPKVAATPTGFIGWTVCHCGLKHRPGAFHLCIDLGTPEPIVAPKPKKTAPKKTYKVKTAVTIAKGRFCACGKRLTSKAKKQCRTCYAKDHPQPNCGTVAGYNRHRRLAAADPANNPWPLPDADPCGCRAAIAEQSRHRRGPVESRPCARCGEPIPTSKPRSSIYCGDVCQTAVARDRRLRRQREKVALERVDGPNRGSCGSCGRVMQVRDNGLLRQHKDSLGVPCAGSRQPPQAVAA